MPATHVFGAIVTSCASSTNTGVALPPGPGAAIAELVIKTKTANSVALPVLLKISGRKIHLLNIEYCNMKIQTTKNLLNSEVYSPDITILGVANITTLAYKLTKILGSDIFDQINDRSN